MSQLAKTIRENITRILTEKGVSKYRLAALTGIAQANLVRLLNGKSEMQTDTIQKIADALEVPVNEIVLEHDHAVT